MVEEEEDGVTAGAAEVGYDANVRNRPPHMCNDVKSQN